MINTIQVPFLSKPTATVRASRGITLLELIVAVAVASVVLAVVGLVSLHNCCKLIVAAVVASVVLAMVGLVSLLNCCSSMAMIHYVDLDSTSRDVLDRMTEEIRRTQYLADHRTNQLTFAANS